MTRSAEQKWQDFHAERAKGRHPRWPLEAMVKIVFGSYLSRRIELPAQASVLDVGCGFGNNLLPFLDRGMRASGVEVTPEIARIGMGLLKERGFDADLRSGSNRSIPFGDAEFDLLLSLNVIHYERDESGILAALAEYSRVMKPGAAAVIFTVGPEHTIYRRAEKLGHHRYRIANYDFRDGEEYFYFDDPDSLREYVQRSFESVELARVTERYPAADLDFLIAVARKRA
jgi:SAM-dependent methyltransferase